MSTALRRKAEEQSLRALRELTALPHNKKCQECQQRGTTYADMTTNGFACTTCSGFLRGLNPPHRVKSISMTTFSEAELEQLKKGGNEIARSAWLGKWDTRKDREPNKEDEVAFKEHLICKYDRRLWYLSPEEASKSAEKKAEPRPEPKLQPPPSSSRSPARHIHHTTQSQSTPAPSITAPPTTTVTSEKKAESLLDFTSDPFAPKRPAGAVSVLPPGAVPTLKTKEQKSDEFGAFTGAPLTPIGSQSSAPLTSSLLPTSSTSTSAAPVLSASDKYAALATLDESLKILTVKDEPNLAQTPPTSRSMFPANANATATATSTANPFGGSSNVQSNPFLASQNQPVTGVQQPGQGFGAQPAMGGAFQQQAGGFPGQVVPGQQMFGGQQQMFGAFGQQQPGARVGYIQQVQQPGGRGGGGGGYVQQVPPQQQWGGQMPQQGQFGGFVGAQFPGGVAYGGIPVQQAPQFAGGAQFGGGMQQFGGQQFPQQQARYPMAVPGGTQFGGMQQPPVGQFGMVGGGGGQMQGGGGGGMFGAQQQQQQQQPGQQQQQFGGFVSAAQPQQKPANQFNWGPVPPPVSKSVSSSQVRSTAQTGAGSAGWSSTMSKPVSASSSWSAAPSPQTSTGWSSGLSGGGGGGHNWGAFSQASGTTLQPQQATGSSGAPVNPFVSPSSTSQTNPFL